MEPVRRTSSESLDHSDSPLLDSEKSLRFSSHGTARRRIPWMLIIPWVLCLLLLVGIFVQTTTLVRNSYAQRYWARSELEVAKREAPMITKQIKFTGGIYYNESSHLNRIVVPGIPDYAGFPSKEIDAAWHEILQPMDLFMTAEEVQENMRNGGGFTDLPEGEVPHVAPLTGLYQAVPTVFHNLHCLNKIRQAVYVDYYQQERTDIFWIHIQHCLDGIRQALMCNSDLTPIPEGHTDFRPQGSLFPVFQVHHTCRDFKAIQNWARSRDVTDEAIWRKNVEKNNPGYFDNHR